MNRSFKTSNSSINKVGNDPPLRTVNNANFGRISHCERSAETLIRGSIDNQSRIVNEPDRLSSQTPLNTGSSSHNLPIPSETFEQIRSEHKMLGRLFCDPSFPADESSLYYSRRPPCSIVWMRPPEIVSAMCRTDVLGIAPRKIHYPEFIADGTIRLGDLRQGELGDCWVVAALASMVTQPRLTMRSIPQGQSFRAEWYTGCFCFRFWQFGSWEEVIIDDRLPVRPGGRPLFIHSSRHTEFWPALLEKAYAKLSGSYEALNVGLIGDAMDDIIGGLTESYCLAPGEDQGMRPPPDLDDILIKAFDRRSLITARIKFRINRIRGSLLTEHVSL
nr:hypothetical transcript [Hymenolepis microstoma]